MACKSIKTMHGNIVEVEDEIGRPIGLCVEDMDGRAHTIYLSVEDAREIARALEAFAVIHEPQR